MTAQIHDNIVWDGSEYRIIAEALQDDMVLLHPAQCGMNPVMMHTGCYHGYYSDFIVMNDKLYLNELNVRDGQKHYPMINGNKPEYCKEKNTARYAGLQLPIVVTGTLRIGKDFIRKRYVHMGFQEALSFRVVIDLMFEDGNLRSVQNRSRDVSRMRRARKSVKTVLEKYLPNREKMVKLFDSNGIDYSSDIERTFYPKLDALDADRVYAILKEIKSQRCTPAEFMRNYSEYYDQSSWYEFSFSYIAKQGCPSRLISFLRKLVSEKCSEEQVVVAFLETMRTRMAKGLWSENIDVITGKQYAKAGVVSEVKAVIEKRLSKLMPDSWSPTKRQHQ